MHLSDESYRTRWIVLVIAWTLAAVALIAQATLIRDYLGVAGELGLRGAAAPSTPLSMPYPAFAADAQTWVRHSLALIEGHDLQLRYTTIDNAPYGREVHWNSAWAWCIAGAGWIYHQFTGVPLIPSVERATIYLGPVALLALLITLSTWVTRRAGVLAGVIIVVAMVCHDRIYEGFFPSYVDHHGLLTVAAFGLMLGATFMGGGWWQEVPNPRIGRLLPSSPQQAREAAVFSALCGAAGMWVSAASAIAPIALVGISGVVTLFLQGRTARENGSAFDGQTWRVWGRVGAVASLVFYLLEYFPRHLGLRLEANHPLHALAWFGAGELIAAAGERRFGPPENRWNNLHELLWPVIAVCLAPLTIGIFGAKVASFLDPFMATLHKDYIQEFLPLWKTVRGFEGRMKFEVIVGENIPFLAAIATLTFRRKDNAIVLWFATCAAGLFTLMAWWQSRWLLNASGIQITLALVVLATWTSGWRPLVRWLLGLALVSALYLPSGILRYTGSRSDVEHRRVAPKDALSMLQRDVAAALRASQPQGEIILLSSPNASTGIGYYGRFSTLGTLYWENHDGLKAAAEIFSARTDAEAAELIRKRHITHLAMVTPEDFIPQYYLLLHPEAKVEEIQQSFGYRLLYQKIVPQWLEMLQYSVPPDLASLKPSLMLFKVNFAQNVAEALYHVALGQIAMGEVEGGEKTLELLLKQAPQAYQPWLRMGEVMIARHNWDEAYADTVKGITLAPPAERLGLYVTAAGAFYNAHQPRLAVQLYRSGLQEQPGNADLSCYLAWILATSTEDSLRNGPEALRLAEAVISSNPNSPTYLNTLAAALAENGRFPEAVAQADRALASAGLKGDVAAMQSSELRLNLLKTGKPIRQ